MDFSVSNAKKFASGVRSRVLEHVIRNGGGYVSQACSSAEMFACLYGGILNIEKLSSPMKPGAFPGVPSAANKDYIPGYVFNGPHRPELDRFILSPTHYSLVLYAALIEAGRLDNDSMAEFNKDGSTLEQIGAEHSPGMEVMTGSLGQGLSQAVGMALGRRMKAETGKTWVFMSDGEFQIGMTWEALQFMSHYKLDTVCIMVDVNSRQCDGRVDNVMCLGELPDKIKSFGAQVITVDGHDIEAVVKAANTPHTGRPLVILCHTNPEQGAEHLFENKEKLHYFRVKNDNDKKRLTEALDKIKGGA